MNEKISTFITFINPTPVEIKNSDVVMTNGVDIVIITYVIQA